MKSPFNILVRGVQGYGFEQLERFVLRINGKLILDISGEDCNHFHTPIYIAQGLEFETEPQKVILHSEIAL